MQPRRLALAALPALAFAALALVLYFGLLREDPEALPSTMIDKPAPTLAPLGPLEGLDGFARADLTAPGVKLVNFWASWCVPCRAEHAQLTTLAEEGVAIYGIDYKDMPGAARSFLRDLGNPFAGVMADPGRTGIEWGLTGVPETFVIDAEGRVRLRFAGPITPSILENRIRPAIAAARGASG